MKVFTLENEGSIRSMSFSVGVCLVVGMPSAFVVVHFHSLSFCAAVAALLIEALPLTSLWVFFPRVVVNPESVRTPSTMRYRRWILRHRWCAYMTQPGHS